MNQLLFCNTSTTTKTTNAKCNMAFELQLKRQMDK